jgi:hypothetical protein
LSNSDNLYIFNLYKTIIINPGTQEEKTTKQEIYPELIQNMHEGQYYKIQLAFVDEEQQTGYWSTAGVTKLIGYPLETKVEYSGGICLGTYTPNILDPNEILYSSYFILKHNGNIIE